MSRTLYVGLMSGTSVDAIDTAIVHCSGGEISLVATREPPIPADVRGRIAQLSHPGDNEIERLGTLDRELGQLFADATLETVSIAGLTPADITAIGSHGQTVRHRPPSGSQADCKNFTLQIGDPNTIAEGTGITTVADFRRRDMAAGGQGAPLAPAFHAAAFAKTGVNRAIVNIGGLANATLLAGQQLLEGFDTGPGNTLLDLWARCHHPSWQYDLDGNWAASGAINGALLANLLQHPYLEKQGPRSTGKEEFNLSWLDSCLAEHPPLAPCDVQATLLEYTAITIARGLDNCDLNLNEVYACGGGVHNTALLQRLRHHLEPAALETTITLGIDPDWVEATAFAWLACQTLAGMNGNAPAVTGALGPRVLGGVFAGARSV